ncbi:tRNase Z TRZ3, mitochondrial isoform X2 [Cicer arietinum]|uniref:ribonuclease Z n=2 Tax=Cicer arietinum TaxID=3827 RepID=A0A1S2XBH5_CICAR|nr:tRNase Z TRZ3, mitochondrial isoform X1 [Cicer arietinum]
MAQILNFRHIPFLSSKPNSHLRFLSTLIASSSRRRRNVAPLNLRRRYTAMEVEESSSLGPTTGFNKRRAEGTDKTNFTRKNLQLKVRKLNPINTISYVQILGTGMDTQDTSPAVLLFFDNQRFIFNAGEGLQRFCTEHRIKLSKIDHIFLSRVCSETAGGLPGLLLTLAGMGEEGMTLNIWGPSDLKYLIDAMRSFIPNAAMVHTKSFGPTFGTNESTVQFQSNNSIVLVDDEVVKISAIILQPSNNESQLLKPCQSPSQRADHSTEILDSPNGKKLPAAKPGDMSVVYVCELPEIKGKFDPGKAKALGLRPGPKYRELQLGNSVESDHQNVMVHPSDVLGPSIPGPIVLLVDCPTEFHLEALLSSKSLATYGDQVEGNLPKAGKGVACVIHLSPESVVSCSKYQTWMKAFGSAQHIMAGHEKKNVEIPILKASARIAARLNYLCPRFFPAPGFWSLPNHNCSKPGSLASSEDSLSALSNVINAENLLKFTLRPYVNLGLDRSCIPTTASSSEIIDELQSEIPEVVEAAQHVSQLWQDCSQTKDDLIPVADHKMVIEEPWLCEDEITPACLENVRRDDLEIVLLGTGSSQPSKYRNVSSIYINLFSKGGLLLDCGEGTLGQLKRRYGVSGADDVVRSLSCIWISHIHADHHTGLARILALRRDLLKGVPHEPVLVVGPNKLKRYLNAYQRLEDLDMLFLNCKHTTKASLDDFENDLQETVNSQDLSNNNAEINASKVDSTLFAKGSRMESYWKRPDSPVDKGDVYPLLRKLKRAIHEAGLNALISFPVVHCPQSFGVVLKAEERTNSVGKVIPGWKIVYSGDTRPCPELIEASRGATVLIHEATFEEGMVEEAIAKNHSTTNEAIEMGEAANVYRIILTHFSQRYPKIPVFDKTHMHKTCVAFDMMSINIADLPVLPKVLPYLKLLFRNDMIVDESDDVVDVASSAS